MPPLRTQETLPPSHMASDHRVLADMLGTHLRILGYFEMTEPTLESLDEESVMIGHNGGPDLDPLSAHDIAIRDIAEMASGLTEITTQDQADAVDAMLDDCKKAIKAAEESRKAEKKPHDEAATAVQSRWKPVIAIGEKAKDEIAALLTPWKRKLEAERQERIEAARNASEALQAEARAKLSSDDIADRAEAEIALTLASKATAKANAIGREATGLRTIWKAEITDRRAALNHYIKTRPDEFEALLEKLADRDARGVRPPVSGVVYHEEKSA